MIRRLLVALLLTAGAVFAQDRDEVPSAEIDGTAREARLTAQPEADAAKADGGETLSARARYNLGLQHLAEQAPENAATAFVAARDEAGQDLELRYRAAFNLGVALAAHADEQQAQSPGQAIQTLRSAAAWFNDAIRIAPEDDDDARVNLEIVLRRIQQLADQLNQGNRLEARLARIIDDQRGLRDRIRRLLATVESKGAGTEPVGFKREFDELATFERALLAEAGTIADLAAEERALIEEESDEARSQQDTVRAFQLQSLDHYLQRARQSLSDARRRLRRLEAERAHRRADAALSELKQAREQLLDSVTVLEAVARDEASLFAHTQALAALQGGGLRLDRQRHAEAPPWLTSEHLGERQQDVAARAGEVRARLEAGAAAAGSTAAEPQQQKAVQAAQSALPHLQTATAAMADARSALSARQLAVALEHESQAVRDLHRAIERFAGVRDLIELAFADQMRVVQLLTPPDDPGQLAELSAAERTRMVAEAVDGNRNRLERLAGLLQDERLAAEARARQNANAQADPSQLEAIGARYSRAEELRTLAAGALQSLGEQLATLAHGADTANVLAPAETTLGHLEELRRLFFSLIEHLNALLSEQSETHDQTATLQFEVATDRLAPELDLASRRQTRHAATGDSLVRALAQQADAASASENSQAQQSSGNLAEAANEMRAATGQMQSAGAVMADALQHAAAMSPDLEPALTGQLAAIEHIENAIALLRPPEQQNPGEQQEQNQRPAQPSQDQQLSQRQALRRLQSIRDREAQRQRQRERAASQPEPVEKDW